MNLVKRLLQTATVAVAFVAATAVMTNDAAAQHCGGGVVGHGIVHGGHHGGLHGGLYHGGLYGGCHTTLYPGYSPGFYHDTSHWDHHPEQYIWHGDHWDVIPAHSHWHQTGHWHGGGVIYP